MRSKELSVTSVPEPSDPAPTDLQSSLFNGWHSKNPDHSRTLDFSDALPKFSLTHTRPQRKPIATAKPTRNVASARNGRAVASKTGKRRGGKPDS